MRKTSVHRESNSLMSSSLEAEKPRAPTHREALWIVAAVLPTVFIAAVDQTIVAGALPSIGREFGASQNLSWVVSAYLITLTAATPLFGKMSDIAGRRLMLRTGLLIFMAGGIAAALAPNLPMLILARAMQGVGGAGLTSQALTILGDIAPPKERARYYTYFSIVYTTAGGIGPALGGFLTQHAHWTLVFVVTLPLGLASLVWSDRLLKNLPRHQKPHKLDLLGAALIVAASTTFLFVITAGGKTYPWTSGEIALAASASALGWVLFCLRQTRAPEPLIPLHILKSRIVMAAIGASACGWGAIIGLNIYLPLYLQSVHAMTPGEAGLHLMALMVTVNLGALMGSLASARMERYKLYPIATSLICIIAMAWLAWRVDTISQIEFQLVLVAIGLGFGPMAPVVTLVVQNSVKMSDLGAATSTLSFGRGLFSAVLVAAFGAVALQALGASGAPLPPGKEIAVDAFRIVFWLASASFAFGLASFMLIEERPLQSSNAAR
jgi:MFS family permease